MILEYTPTARRLGIASAVSVVVLLVVYALTHIIGLLSLETPDQQIGDPMFTILEIPIVAVLLAILFHRSEVTDTSHDLTRSASGY
jgi:hypothetical protein